MLLAANMIYRARTYFHFLVLFSLDLRSFGVTAELTGSVNSSSHINSSSSCIVLSLPK